MGWGIHVYVDNLAEEGIGCSNRYMHIRNDIDEGEDKDIAQLALQKRILFE